MTIGIVTDSTCDLPEDVAAEHGISVVPLYINFNHQGYLDGIELPREEFYTRLPDANPLPTTATPSQLPLALEALRFGDRELFPAHPELDRSPIWVHFHATQARYARVERWGVPADYR